MKDWIKYCLYIILYTFIAAICFVLPDFLDNPIDDISGIITLGLYTIAISIASFFLLYLAGLNKYIFAIFLPFYAVVGTIVAFYRYFYKATITPIIIDCTLHTNAEEINGIISWQLILFVFINLFIAILFIIYRFKKINAPKPLWLNALICIILFFAYYYGNSRLHQSLNQRYPINVVHNFIEYVQLQQDANIQRELIHCQEIAEVDSISIIFVLGEAVRADHISLNGYDRQTCPTLSQKENVVSLSNIFSEYTYTSASVPHILTCADSISQEKAYSTLSFIQCFEKYDYATTWISNQDMGKTYASFIQEADTAIFPNADKSVFVFSEWFDEEMLIPLDSILAHKADKNLYVFHTIGSHWYYNNHVPTKYQIFQPTTDNRVVTNNDSIAVVNAYDNTIVAIDAFLSQIIERFENDNAIMIYLADHGESLGESGCWLHASGAKETQYPASIIWYSNKYADNYPEKIQALKGNSTKRYRTDFLFYSILSAAGIEADGNNAKVNIFMKEEE